jgi:methyl-accepting chemotaxis protein
VAQPLTEIPEPRDGELEPGPPREVAPASASPAGRPRRPSPQVAGPGLQAKIVLFLVVVLAVLSLLAGLASSLTLQSHLTTEAGSKGEAVAHGLAGSAEEPLAAGDGRGLERRLRQVVEVEDVLYAAVYDDAGRLRGEAGAVPVPDDVPAVAAGAGGTSRATSVVVDGAARRVVDVAVPIAGGDLGTARVGIDLAPVSRQARKATLDLLVMIGMLAAVAVLFALLFTSRIVGPVRRLVQVARKVGRGDLSTLAPVHSRDEIGLLARTFNESVISLRDLVQTVEERDAERRRREQLQENIREFLRETMLIADGDLTRRGRVTEDVLGNVVDSINVAVDGIEEVLLGVREAAATVNLSAQEMIGATDRFDDAVQRQAADARDASDEVERVTESLREVTEDVESASGSARETLDSAQRGQQAVEDTLASMERIRGEVQSLALRIKSLGDRSLEISEVVDTLSGIATQTNLLALNAAIEASGAGAEGARFAVVADEVRKLAEDSSRSAKRVAQLIKTVQAEVQDAVVAMDTSSREVETGVRVTRQAGDRLDEIARLSDTSAALVERIAAGSRRQVQGVELVADRVGSISERTSASEATALGGRRAAEQLLRLSEELNQRLDRFHLGGRDPGAVV